MSKKYTRLSYAERIMNPSCCNNDYKVHNLVINICRRVQCMNEKLKRIFYKNEFVPEDPESNFSKYRVSDFSIENLSAIGKLDSLQPTKISGDKFTSIANLEKQFSSMSNSTKTD